MKTTITIAVTKNIFSIQYYFPRNGVMGLIRHYRQPGEKMNLPMLQPIKMLS